MESWLGRLLMSAQVLADAQDMSLTIQLPELLPREQSIPIRMLETLQSRAYRVVLLLTIALVLGIADLAMTLTYLMNVGMFEGNPLARWIIAMGSPLLVVGFKLMTIVVSSTILLSLRHRWQGEFGAWLAVIVLAKLTLHWFGYIAGSSEMTQSIAMAAADPTQCDGLWVSLQ